MFHRYTVKVPAQLGHRPDSRAVAQGAREVCQELFGLERSLQLVCTAAHVRTEGSFASGTEVYSIAVRNMSESETAKFDAYQAS